MKWEKWQPLIKWGGFSLLLLLFYALQTTPGLLQIASVKPVLIVSLIVCVSMYEGAMASAFYSMTAGLLWDISSDKLFGFNGLILMLCGLLISLLCIYYLHTKLVNSLLFCSVTAFLQGLLDYVFYYAVWNADGAVVALVRNILPTAAYTVAITPLIFFLVRAIERRLSPIERV